MLDPFDVLGLPADSDDDTIRRRYLELVRQHTPERSPQKFSEIRAAYESLKDLDTRLRKRLFDVPKTLGLEAIIEEATCQSSRRRLSLDTLLQVARTP
jgi:DnaJ-class molecular chaperone